MKKESLLLTNVLYGGLPKIFQCEPTTKTKHIHYWKCNTEWYGETVGPIFSFPLWMELDPESFCLIWTSNDGYLREYRGTPIVFRMSGKAPRSGGEGKSFNKFYFN